MDVESQLDGPPRWWYLREGLIIWAELTKIETRGKPPNQWALLHLWVYDGGLTLQTGAQNVRDIRIGDGSEPDKPGPCRRDYEPDEAGCID